MWKQITNTESCKLLRQHTNGTYTIPSGMDLYYKTDYDGDVTYYFKETNTPLIEIRKSWNDKGLWETTYWKWEV